MEREQTTGQHNRNSTVGEPSKTNKSRDVPGVVITPGMFPCDDIDSVRRYMGMGAKVVIHRNRYCDDISLISSLVSKGENVLIDPPYIPPPQSHDSRRLYTDDPPHSRRIYTDKPCH